MRPKAGEDIVGSTTEQQIKLLALRRDNGLSRHCIVERCRPSAVGIVAVSLGPPGAWITPSSEMCSKILSLLIASPFTLAMTASSNDAQHILI